MEVQKEFDEYIEKYLKGKELPEVAEIQKKDNSKYKFRDDGHNMIMDLDMFMPPDDSDPSEPADGEISKKIYHNIWELLDEHGFDRGVVELVEMKYNNVLNRVDKLSVTLISGDVAIFNDVQLG